MRFAFTRRTSRAALLFLSILLIALVVLLMFDLPHSAHPVRAQESAEVGAETLIVLQRAVVPPRDRADLARRLLGVTQLPAARATPIEYEIGAIRTFRATNLDTGERFDFTARLDYKSAHSYMWFEESFKPNFDAVRRSAENFDRRIYPVVRAYFGSEAQPGIDGDPRLHILHARNLGRGVAAYFDPESEFPRVIAPESNEGQVFLVNLDTMARLIGTPGYEGTLAHEFQHMIHANIDLNESAWLDEGMAELAAALAGYRISSGFVTGFTSRPETQLNTWPVLDSSEPHYGASYLFVTYFLQRFGADALRALVANPLNDLEGVTDTLRRTNATDPVTGAPLTAETLFADWVMATLLNDPRAGDGRFAYTALPSPLGTVNIAHELTRGSTQRLKVSQFGTTYLSIDEPGRYTLTFRGESSVRVIPPDPRSGAKLWWSNRGDQIDTRLTRRFDLRGVSAATLTFWLWHSIEDNWDYGYVQASTDGGQTWTALAAEDSQPAGGHNNPYGPAYTGTSGPGRSAVWRQQRVDLSAYAGREVDIRFEYLTDDAVNDYGMVIDDISIPEIGYSSDAESDDGGWAAEGWVRIANVLPQRYLVQVAQFPTNGEAPRVARLLNSGVAGEWQFEIGSGVKRIVLAVSGLTQFTTQKAEVQITLSSR